MTATRTDTGIVAGDTVRPVIDPELAKKLEKLGKQAVTYRAERDALIRKAHREGAGVREIARLVGMTHPGVLRILNAPEP